MSRIYYQYVDITDFGPYVTKLILGLPAAVKKENLSPDQFNVFVQILDKNGEPVLMPKSFIERDVMLPSQCYREVTAAYPCDRFGNEAEESKFAAVEMKYGPIYKCSSTLVADWSSPNGHEYYAFSDYTVTQTAPIQAGDKALTGMVFDRCAGILNPKKDRFKESCSSDPEIPIRYGYYVPQAGKGKKPLIIFLHGAGEGGMDTPIAYSGNKVTEFTEDWVQEKFGGAYVLVPQCETMWLDDGSHQYGDSGKSMYTKALKSLIDEFIKKNANDIDTKRIYIGGDSNGGFMTMRMIMSYPKFFAAAYPICEAMIDKRITDKDIANMKDQAIWFTHAKNDPVVIPDQYVVPTYERLMAAGAKNVHFTFWDKIEDIHAGFKKEDGTPYEYLGHFAWIPMLNDDCKVDYDGKPVVVDGREVTLMDWMALQHR